MERNGRGLSRVALGGSAYSCMHSHHVWTFLRNEADNSMTQFQCQTPLPCHRPQLRHCNHGRHEGATQFKISAIPKRRAHGVPKLGRVNAGRTHFHSRPLVPMFVHADTRAKLTLQSKILRTSTRPLIELAELGALLQIQIQLHIESSRGPVVVVRTGSEGSIHRILNCAKLNVRTWLAVCEHRGTLLPARAHRKLTHGPLAEIDFSEKREGHLFSSGDQKNLGEMNELDASYEEAQSRLRMSCTCVAMRRDLGCALQPRILDMAFMFLHGILDTSRRTRAEAL